MNASVFLTELSKIKDRLPDWVADKDGYELRDWKGCDYLLTKSAGYVTMKKRKSKSIKFRVDNRVKASDYDTAHKQLKNLIGLP